MMDLYDDIYTTGAQSPDTTIENRELDNTKQDDGRACSDLDLYDDLITEEGQQQMDSYKELCKKLEAAVSKINFLEVENKKLKEESQKYDETQKHVQKNISSLLVTARTELSRKEREIKSLRNQLNSPFFKRGGCNGFRNQMKRSNKDSSESFTSVDSNFEPMLVSSPLDKTKERNKDSVGANDRMLPKGNETQKSKCESGFSRLCTSQKRSNSGKSVTAFETCTGISDSTYDSGSMQNTDIERSDKASVLSNKHEGRNSRIKYSTDRNLWRNRSPRNDNISERKSGFETKWSPEIGNRKLSYCDAKQNSDSSPASSPEKQNHSRTLFSQRAMKKMELSTKTSEKGNGKNSPCDRKIFQDCSKHDKEKMSEEKPMLDTFKSKEIVDRSNHSKKNERIITVSIDEKKGREKDKHAKSNEKEPMKVFDLREKLRLKRQLQDSRKGGKFDSGRLQKAGKIDILKTKTGSKRQLSDEEIFEDTKRKRHDGDSETNRLKLSVEMHTTVVDEDQSCSDIESKASRLSSDRRDKANVSYDSCNVVHVVDEEEARKPRNIISYAETDLLDRNSCSRLCRTFEKEEETKAKIDRLKNIMEHSFKCASDSQKQDNQISNPTKASGKHSIHAYESKTQTVIDLSNEMNYELDENEANKDISLDKDSYVKRFENSLEHSNTSILYANIGEDTFETSGRSSLSDNFDVEIFRTSMRQKDYVSSSSNKMITERIHDENPAYHTKESELIADCTEITSTVMEKINDSKRIEDPNEIKNPPNSSSSDKSRHSRTGSPGEKFSNGATHISKDTITGVDEFKIAELNVPEANLQKDDTKTDEAINESLIENHSLYKDSTLPSYNSESNDLLLDNQDISSSKKKKRKKHKKKKRRSKSVNSSKSSLEESENDRCCEVVSERVSAPTEVLDFPRSAPLSKYSSTDEQCNKVSRTPKSERNASFIYRGVISETVSTKTSNVIDHDEIFLSPARPSKTKKRSNGEVQVQKSPVRSHESNLSKIHSDKGKVLEQLGDHSKLMSDKENNECDGQHMQEEGTLFSSSSGTSVSSYSTSSDGSFGSNILSEKTSSLSSSNITDTSLSSFTSRSSCVSTSATSVASSIEKRTKSMAAAATELSEKENDIDIPCTSSHTTALKNDEVISNRLNIVPIAIENNEVNCAYASKKPLLSENSLTNTGTKCVENREKIDVINCMFSGNDHLKQKLASAELEVTDKINGNALNEKDTSITSVNKIVSEKISAEIQDDIRQNVKRRRHHTDGCLVSNRASKNKKLSDRVVCPDRSLLLECLLNEVTLIVDKKREVQTKRKYNKTGDSKKHYFDNLTERPVTELYDNDVPLKVKAKDVALDRGPSVKELAICEINEIGGKVNESRKKTTVSEWPEIECDVKVQDADDYMMEDRDERQSPLCEINTTNMPILGKNKSEKKTNANKILEHAENKDDCYAKRAFIKHSEVSPEEIVFGSWTGLSVSMSNSTVNETASASPSKISLYEETHIENLDQSPDNHSVKMIQQSSTGTRSSNEKNILAYCHTKKEPPGKRETNILPLTLADSNPYFEIDEQPGFLNTQLESMNILPETNLSAELSVVNSSVSSNQNSIVVIQSESSTDDAGILNVAKTNDIEVSDSVMKDNHDIKFDLTDCLRKASPNKVRMVKRPSPVKLKSNSKTNWTTTNQSISGKKEPIFIGYFSSPEKLLITPEKSVSADNVLSSILKRNVASFCPDLKSSLQRKNKADPLDEHANNETEGKNGKLVKTKQSCEPEYRLENAQQKKNQMNPRISIAGKETVLRNSNSITDQNKSQFTASVEISEVGKTEKNKTVGVSFESLNDNNDKRKSSLQNHTNIEEKVGSASTRIRRKSYSEKCLERNTKERKTFNTNSQDEMVGTEISLKTEGMNSLSNEKVEVTVPLRRSPRKKCNISNETDKVPQRSEAETLKEKQKENETSKKIIRSEVKARSSSSESKHKFQNKNVQTLQTTPSKIISANGSKFDESESPAKNTRSATKLIAEKKMSYSRDARGQSEFSSVVNSLRRGKVQKSCKKNLAFSKSTPKEDIRSDPFTLKICATQRKMCDKVAMSNDRITAENIKNKTNLNDQMRQPLENTENSSLESAGVDFSRKYKHNEKVECLLESEMQNKREVNPRKSKGYTDLHKSCKKNLSSKYKASQLQESAQYHSSQVTQQGKDNEMVSKGHYSEHQKKLKNTKLNAHVNYTRSGEKQPVEKCKRNIEAKENNIPAGQLVTKVNGNAKTDKNHKEELKHLKHDRENIEISKPYRIPKLKPKQQRKEENSDSTPKPQLSKANHIAQGKVNIVRNNKLLNLDGSSDKHRVKLKESVKISDVSENTFSMRSKQKPLKSTDICVEVLQNSTYNAMPVKTFAGKLSEVDSLNEKKLRRNRVRQKSGYCSETGHLKVEKQHSEPEYQKRKSEVNVRQTFMSQIAGDSALQNEKPKPVRSCNLQNESGKRMDSKLEKHKTYSMLDSAKKSELRKSDDNTDSDLSESYLEKCRYVKEKQRKRSPIGKIDRKNIIDKMERISPVSAYKSYKKIQSTARSPSEIYESESIKASRTDHSDSYCGTDSDSDKDSVLTDRTAILNRSLFGSDSSGDDSTDSCIYQHSPAKISTLQTRKSCTAKTEIGKINHSKRKNHHSLKEVLKEKNRYETNKHSKKETESENCKNITKEHLGTDLSSDVSSFPENQSSSRNSQNYVDEQTQCSFSVSYESRSGGSRARHGSCSFDCSSDGIQNYTTTATTSASGTLLLDLEDTLDHTDYVDTLALERSFLSNTSNPDSSFHESSSQSSEVVSDLNESLEDGEVMSSENEASDSIVKKSDRIQCNSKVCRNEEKRKAHKIYSPVKFPEDLRNEKSDRNPAKIKSVNVTEGRKESTNRLHEKGCTLDSENDRKSQRNLLKKHSKVIVKRRDRSYSHSPRRYISSESPSEKVTPKTQKSRDGVSEAVRRRLASRSPRPSRRSRSHSPRRKRYQSRSYSRSPRRRFHRSRTRSRERGNYPRHRHRSPDTHRIEHKSYFRKQQSPVTPHRSRHRNTSPHLHYRSRPDKKSKSRSPSGSPDTRRLTREYEHLSHHHRQSACDKTCGQRSKHCCTYEENETCLSGVCKHDSNSDPRRAEPRSRHSPVLQSRHSHRHGENLYKKRKRRSHSCSESGRSRSCSRSRDRHGNKAKRQRANLARHYDRSSEENDE